MEARGIAPLVVIVIVAACAGGAVATPVAVDSIDVDPDHPLYALERIGEAIKRVGDEARMEERFNEFSKMCEKGKGSQFTSVFEDYANTRTKLLTKFAENTPQRVRLLERLQAQETKMVQNRIQLALEAATQLKKDLSGTEDATLCENMEAELTQMRLEVATRLEAVEAKLELIEQKVEQLKEAYRNRVDARVRATVEARKKVKEELTEERVETGVRPVENIEEKLSEVEAKITKLEAELVVISQITVPVAAAKVAPAGCKAVESLVTEAKELRDKAVTAISQGRTGAAFGTLMAVEKLLGNAERILEHAEEWEREHENAWKECKGTLAQLSERIREEVGTSIENLPPAAKTAVIEIAHRIVQEVTGAKEEYVALVENLRAQYAGEENRAREELLSAVRGAREIRSREGFTNFLASWSMPWRHLLIPVTGRVVDGNLIITASSSDPGMVSFSDATGVTVSASRSWSLTVNGTILDNRMTGTMEGEAEIDLVLPQGTSTWTLDAEGRIEGYAQPIVVCEVEGTGTLRSEGNLSFGTWSLQVSLTVDGRLVGRITENSFQGYLYLNLMQGARTIENQNFLGEAAGGR